MPFITYALTFANTEALSDHTNHANPVLFCTRQFLSAFAPWTIMDISERSTVSTYFLRLLFKFSPGTAQYATKLAPSNRSIGKGWGELEQKYFSEECVVEMEKKHESNINSSKRTVSPSFFTDHLSNLTELNLSAWLNMCDSDFEALNHRNFRLVESMRFPPIAAHVTPAAFANLSTSLPDLRQLVVVRFTPHPQSSLSSSPSSMMSFTHAISKLRNLRTLRLKVCTTLTDSDLSHLADMTSLVELELESLPKVTGRGIAEHVTRIEQLQHLTLGHMVAVGNEGFLAVAARLGEQLHTFVQISNQPPVTVSVFAEGVANFKMCREFRMPLRLVDDTSSGSASSASPPPLNSLHQVRAEDSADTARVQPLIQNIFSSISANLKHTLRVLQLPSFAQLPHNVLGDDACAMLGECTLLEKLTFPPTRRDVLGIGVVESGDGIASANAAASVPTALTHRHFKFLRSLASSSSNICCHLKTLRLDHCQITDTVLGAIGAASAAAATSSSSLRKNSNTGGLASSLEELGLSDNLITDDGVLSLNSLLHIKSLDLGNNPRLTSAVMRIIGNNCKFAPWLQSLSLSNCTGLGYRREDAMALKKCTVLRLLDVVGCVEWMDLTEGQKEAVRAEGRRLDFELRASK